MSLLNLSDAIQNYGNAFKVCYSFFDNLRDGNNITDEQSAEIQDLISHLDLNYSIFTSELYDEIKDITDYQDDQNLIFTQIKAALPSVIFDNELSDYDTKEAYIEKWGKYPNGYSLIKLIEILYISLGWFDGEDLLYPFNRFIDKCATRYGDRDRKHEEQNLNHLMINLNSKQCDYLYVELTRDSIFIPVNTNKNHFNYVFGGGKPPYDFAPLKWKVSKRSLSELLLLLLGTASISRPRQRDAGKLFLNSQNELMGNLSNPKKNEPSNDFWALETIVKSMKAHP